MKSYSKFRDFEISYTFLVNANPSAVVAFFFATNDLSAFKFERGIVSNGNQSVTLQGGEETSRYYSARGRCSISQETRCEGFNLAELSVVTLQYYDTDFHEWIDAEAI